MPPKNLTSALCTKKETLFSLFFTLQAAREPNPNDVKYSGRQTIRDLANELIERRNETESEPLKNK